MSSIGSPAADPAVAHVIDHAAPLAPAPAPATAAPENPPGPSAAVVAEGDAAAVVDPAASPSPGADPALAAPKPDWKDRRIAQLTAKLKDKSAAAPVADAPDHAAPLDSAGLDAEANRRADIIATQRDFNRRCGDVAKVGKAAFSDFDDRIGNLQHLYTPGNSAEEAAYVTMLAAALETDDPARVLYELGGDMDNAEKLMQLSPVKLGMEMAKLASKKSEADPSSLPKPITPVGVKGQTHAEIDPADAARSDNLSTKTWMQRRQAYIESQRKQGVRIA